MGVPAVPPQERLADAGIASGSHRFHDRLPGPRMGETPPARCMEIVERLAAQPAARSERLSPGALSSAISGAGTGRLKW